MAEITGIQAIRLFELLSAPMIAMVQADVQAARATVDFIESVGFVPETQPPSPEGKMGRLRMAEFRYQKVDENGKVSDFTVSIPLLSLVPIPAIQIKQAKVGLTAKITDVIPEKAPPARAIAGSTILATRRLDILAKPVSSSGTKGQETRGSFDLELEITLGQADVTVGMEKVFQLLDQAVTERKAQSS
jgi:hypothetical protein